MSRRRKHSSNSNFLSLITARADWDRYWAHRNRFRQEQQIRELLCRNWYPLPYPFLAMQEARGYALDSAKFKRDHIRMDLDAEKCPENGAASRDSEDDDVDVDDEGPAHYTKTTGGPPSAEQTLATPLTANESLKKKWSRQAVEAARESPSRSPAPHPSAAHTHPLVAAAAAAASANEKGDGNFFPLHPLIDRSLYEKGLLSNLKPNAILARAT